jgi:hypothetical protein
MVNRIHYIQGRKITFSKDSVPKVVGNLQKAPQTPLAESLMARALNRQIKGSLELLLDELHKEVLVGFNRGLKRGKGNLIRYLCIFLLLCMCAEEVQVAVDGFVRHKLSEEGEDEARLYKLGTDSCCRLEFYAEHSFLLLKGRLGRKGTNALKHGLPLNGKSGFSDAEVKFVNEFRQIILQHGNSFMVAPLGAVL